MDIEFLQIYCEPDASFDLSGMVLLFLCTQLNLLHKDLPSVTKKLSHINYNLVFIINARYNQPLEVKGPKISRKKNEVQFCIHIPYKKFSNFHEKIGYVLQCISEGIVSVFNNNGADSSDINKTIQFVIENIQKNPLDYQYAQ